MLLPLRWEGPKDTMPKWIGPDVFQGFSRFSKEVGKLDRLISAPLGRFAPSLRNRSLRSLSQRSSVGCSSEGVGKKEEGESVFMCFLL